MKTNTSLSMANTVFEEQYEDLRSFSISHSTPDLQSSIDIWSQVTRKPPDVRIRVQSVCFRLHKEAVTSKSGYLKRQLKEVSEITLSPPLKLTVEAFKIFAQFCYQCDVVFTPFNVAPLLVAAALLEVGGDGIRRKAESYFSRVIAINRDLSASVFISSLSLMPEAEELVFLPSRCIEALSSSGDSHDGVSGCADALKVVPPVEFRIIAESMQQRHHQSHDFLYALVDLYLKVYNGEISEQEKTRICNCIDCNMLSPQVLMQSVQSPRMPLRFIVQAMLMEQLNTHRSISNAVASSHTNLHHDQPDRAHHSQNLAQDATLSALLQRDAAFQQVAQLKEAIGTTASRIQSLEKELTTMRLKLTESEKKGSRLTEGDNASCKSVSCRFNSKTVNKVEKGERGSISSSNLRFKASPKSDTAKPVEIDTTRTKKRVGQWLIKRLKSALGVSNSGSKKDLSKDGDKVGKAETHGLVPVGGLGQQ